MAVGDNAERWSTWIDKKLARKLRIRSALNATSLRDVTEAALTEWMERNPITAGEVTDALERRDT